MTTTQFSDPSPSPGSVLAGLGGPARSPCAPSAPHEALAGKGPGVHPWAGFGYPWMGPPPGLAAPGSPPPPWCPSSAETAETAGLAEEVVLHLRRYEGRAALVERLMVGRLRVTVPGQGSFRELLTRVTLPLWSALWGRGDSRSAATDRPGDGRTNKGHPASAG